MTKNLFESLPKIKNQTLAVLNGVLGDTLTEQKSGLAIEMSLSSEKQGERVCIFVHGLCASNSSWKYTENKNKSYGSLLEKSRGYTPIYINYNSGLHVSTNGKALSKLISQHCKKSSTTIKEIIFIGHSMGGLVIRSACHYAKKSRASWVKKTRKIFLLGTPHHGNDYEKLGNLTSSVLKRVPNAVTKGIASLGNKRSAGIKDLRFGNLLDEDWQGHDPDALLQDNRQFVPLLKNVDYYIIAGSLAKEKDNIFTQYFGDGVVPKRTAAGKSFSKSKTIPFLANHFKEIKGVSHARLPRHTKVYAQIRKWCDL